MPAIVPASDQAISLMPQYHSLSSIAGGQAGGGAIVPMWGRQRDGDLVASGNYAPGISRNGGTLYTPVYWYLNNVLTYDSLTAATDIPVGRYIAHASVPASSRITSVVGGQLASGSGSGTTISGVNTTQLVVGQRVSGGTVPSGSYIASIINSTSFNLNQAVSTSGSTGQMTFAAYILIDKTGTTQTIGNAVVQTTRYTRSCDMPVAQITAIGGDNKTLTSSYFTAFLQSGSFPTDFYPGDTALLISLQGDGTASGNAGTFEIVQIGAAASGTITLRTALQRTYGRAANNTDLTGQRVYLFRMPEYRKVSINATASIVAGTYDAPTNAIPAGILALQCEEIDTGTSVGLNASATGYRRVSGVTYAGTPSLDAPMTKLGFGEAGSANGIAGGGLVLCIARTATKFAATANGAADSATAGSGGNIYLISQNLRAVGTISAAGGAGSPSGAAGRVKMFLTTYAEQVAALSGAADGAGVFTASTPAGYRQTL